MKNMLTFASLFTGFGLGDVGAMQAKLRPRWGIEYDPDIAAVARQNLPHDITIADILDCNPADFEAVNVLHASPPCPSFSQAKTNAEETKQDVALARKVGEFIEVLRPSVFTLENVYGYRKSKSFHILLKILQKNGYKMEWWHLNAADYGVPQTRKRLILVAALDFWPQRPPATHAPPHKLTPLFDARKPWVGWLEAIEDLIDTLPDSEFANWQLERLPENFKTVLVGGSNKSKSFAQFARENRPSMPGSRHADEPSMVVASGLNTSDFRAFIVDSKNSRPATACRESGPLTIRWDDEPGWTLQSDMFTTHIRAFIIGGANTSKMQSAPGVGVSMEDEPVRLVNANNSMAWRAFVMPNENSSNENYCRSLDEPFITVTASRTNSATARGYVEGRVVEMTARALARFQSVPDSMELPERKTLACKGIGNGLPCLFYQRIVESFLPFLK